MNNTTVPCFFFTVKARQKVEKSNEQCNSRLQYCNLCSLPDLTTSRQQQGVFLLEPQREGKNSPCTQTVGSQLWLALVQRRLMLKCFQLLSSHYNKCSTCHTGMLNILFCVIVIKLLRLCRSRCRSSNVNFILLEKSWFYDVIHIRACLFMLDTPD